MGTALAVLFLAAGCSSSDVGPSGGAETPVAPLPTASDPVTLDPADFTAAIDHPFWPMTPRTRWVYRETDEAGRHIRVVITATTETRELANGVTARIVRDSVTADGELIEDTFDWYAQDTAGAIWYLGEDTAEFENGKVSSRRGSFEAGVDGALPGIMLPAAPEVGMAYRQEYYAGEAEDNGEVLSLDEMAQVPAGFFSGALLTKDTITIKPRVLEYKLYAPEVGPVMTIGVSGGAGREELVRFATVSDDAATAAARTPLGERYG